MADRFETAPGFTGADSVSVLQAVPGARDLDRERRASMADEGGCAAAETELAEQYADLQPLATRGGRLPWNTRWLWGALAIGTAAWLTGLILRNSRTRSPRFAGPRRRDATLFPSFAVRR